MALLKTPEFQQNFTAPAFKLKNIDGKTLSFHDIKGPNGTLIMFICNHCPYVKAIIKRLVEDCRELQKQGIGCVAIMPNDTENYPDDSFDNMKIFAKDNAFTFPYLIDETQQVAKEFGAICTPDIYGFDKEGNLQYRGRCDSAGPNATDKTTIRELRDAMLEIAATGKATAKQHPSMGCSIKWKSA